MTAGASYYDNSLTSSDHHIATVVAIAIVSDTFASITTWQSSASGCSLAWVPGPFICRGGA